MWQSMGGRGGISGGIFAAPSLLKQHHVPVSVRITRHSQGLPIATGTQEQKGLIKTIRRESQTIIRPLRDSPGKVFQRPREQCQIVSPVKDGNEGLGGCLLRKDSCSPAAPVCMYCCQAGQGKLCGRAGMEGRQCCRMPHLLQQTQKLQAAGCPGAAGIFSFPYSQLLAFSPDFLGVPKQREESALSIMALAAAAGQPASSSSVTPTDKLHSKLKDDQVIKAGLSCLPEQDSSEAPGTFLTAPSSRQNRL